MKTVVRVNGIGSAWPVMIGEYHPAYSTGQLSDLSNASYSLINFEGDNPKTGKIGWEVMIDMGHHTIPFLINNENRIPEAAFLTHGHPDHFFGVDWVVQSFYAKFGISKKYPVYATKPVWDAVIRSFSYLNLIAEHKELLPGKTIPVDEVEGLKITSIPVFHGESALGASMLYFENPTAGMKPVLFTGDLLCPLWRKMDIEKIASASEIFIDCTNRFPAPAYNHMSFTSDPPPGSEKENKLKVWLQKNNLSKLIEPHTLLEYTDEIKEYFKEFITDWSNQEELPFTNLSFIKKFQFASVNLVHYSGAEDRKLYGQEILSRKELQEWAFRTSYPAGVKSSIFRFPEVGQLINL